MKESEATTSGRCPDNLDERRLDCHFSVGSGDQQRQRCRGRSQPVSLNGIDRVADLQVEGKQTVFGALGLSPWLVNGAEIGQKKDEDVPISVANNGSPTKREW